MPPGETLSADLFDQTKLDAHDGLPKKTVKDNNTIKNDISNGDEEGGGEMEVEEQEREGEKEEDPSLKHLCADIYTRISSFLRDEPPNDQLRQVQVQTRRSLDVIREALDRYSFVITQYPPPPSLLAPLFAPVLSCPIHVYHNLFMRNRGFTSDQCLILQLIWISLTSGVMF